MGGLGTILIDLARARSGPPPVGSLGAIRLLAGSLLKVRGIAVIGFRLSHFAGSRIPLAGAALKALNHVVTGADIDYRATFGPGLYLPHPTGVVVSGETKSGVRCTIHQGVTLGSKPTGSPHLGDDVNLGPGSRVIGPLVLGDGIHVAPNAVVTRSFPNGHVVLAGTPASVLRSN
jgi:serine O-acetyltransferase